MKILTNELGLSAEGRMEKVGGLRDPVWRLDFAVRLEGVMVVSPPADTCHIGFANRTASKNGVPSPGRVVLER
jgi:hypothetical protein